MLVTLTPGGKMSPRRLRFAPPPDRSHRELVGADSITLSPDVEAARRKESAPDLGRMMKVGLFTALSLAGGAGCAVHGQTVALEQPLREQVEARQLIDASVDERTRDRLAEQISVLGPEMVQRLIDSGLSITTASGLQSLQESGALESVDPESFRPLASQDAPRLADTLSTPMASTVMERTVEGMTDGRWRVYRPDRTSRRDDITVEDIAEDHGFTSESDKAWFSEQVETANAHRLRLARQHTLNKARHESTLGGRKGRRATRRLEQYENDPGSIPFRTRLHPVAVPDYHQFSVYGERFHGTLHDKQTFDMWRDRDTKVGGQYFGEGDQHLIVMTPFGSRDDDTVIHEIGHALERMAERNSPDRFLDFRARLRRAHDGIRPHGRGAEVDPDGGKDHDDLGRDQISHYSRTNSREYLAEGFAHYVKNPERLQKNDYLLFDLVQELVELATPKTVAEGIDQPVPNL